MTIRSLLLALVIGSALLLGSALALRSSDTVFARTLEGDDLLRTQAQSDFDQDGDIDFLDFTVFSAFYEEGV